MNDIARRLRAQKAYSTDPAYLERMARHEEGRAVGASHHERAGNDYREDHSAGGPVMVKRKPKPASAVELEQRAGDRIPSLEPNALP